MPVMLRAHIYAVYENRLLIDDHCEFFNKIILRQTYIQSRDNWVSESTLPIKRQQTHSELAQAPPTIDFGLCCGNFTV